MPPRWGFLSYRDCWLQRGRAYGAKTRLALVARRAIKHSVIPSSAGIRLCCGLLIDPRAPSFLRQALASHDFSAFHDQRLAAERLDFTPIVRHVKHRQLEFIANACEVGNNF